MKSLSPAAAFTRAWPGCNSRTVARFQAKKPTFAGRALCRFSVTVRASFRHRPYTAALRRRSRPSGSTASHQLELSRLPNTPHRRRITKKCGRRHRKDCGCAANSPSHIFTSASKFGHRHSQQEPWTGGNFRATSIHDSREEFMRWSLLAAVSVSPLMMLSLAGLGSAQTPEGTRISGPLVHENLAVYFIHGKSAPGEVPLTLEEAMAKGVVKVRETSNVNQLEIGNLGLDEVFVQSGDIVKGGQQDRTLMVSLLLAPQSGSIPIASFCVEQGRWAARGREDAKNFSTASAAVPSREMKLAMKAPLPAAKPSDGSLNAVGGQISDSSTETGTRQRQVWESVRKTQIKLTGSLGAQVRSVQSGSSLQLALENEKLMDVQK